MQISEHHVRECAYYIWESEGRIHGQAATHWLRAEAELHANAVLAAGPTVTEAAPAAQVAKTPAKGATPKVAAVKAAAVKTTAVKTTAGKPAAPKPAPVKAAAKPAAPKPVRASKAAVTAGLTAKAKPARAPASMH